MSDEPKLDGRIQRTTVWDRAAYDEILDVRSPAEHAEDHAPGAINLPVLDDAERARVGTIYKQESRFLARKIGAALTAKNIARALEGHLADKPGGYAPLVYCWRGGQRSGAMAIVLGQIGWRVRVLEGGYRAYRRDVIAALYHAEPWFHAVALEGSTGVGKTAVLERLAALGAPTLDLEGLAAHRGSVFGATASAQPSQKLFESRLLAALPAPGVDPRTVVALEDEAAKIGDRLIPPALWKAMTRAPRIRLVASVAARARFIAGAYADIAADPARLEAVLGGLTHRQGHARVAAWRALAAEGRIVELVEDLIARHYDPAYERAARTRAAPAVTLELAGLEPFDLDAAAAEIAALIPRLGPA